MDGLPDAEHDFECPFDVANERDASPLVPLERAGDRLVEHEGEIIERHCRTLVIEVHPEFRTDEAQRACSRRCSGEASGQSRASARSTSSRADARLQREPRIAST